MAVPNLSRCALTCLLKGIADAGCSAANATCICESPTLVPMTAACLTASCTMQDTLDVSRLSATTCQLDAPSQSQQVLTITVAMWTIASVAVMLRCLSIYLGRSTHKEDVLVVVTVVTAIVPASCLIKMLSLGFGTHLWSLQDGALSRILELLYIAEIFYVVILCLAKSALLLFYLRIFPSQTFRNVSYAVLGFTIISSLIITFLTIFSCQPVALFWDKDIKGGTCLDVTALAYANAAFAIAEDFMILALPLSQLPKLQIKRGRKFGVAFMIMLGSFGWVATIVRMRALSSFGQSSDPTWDYVPVADWTAIELAVIVVCGCVPAIRSLLARYFPRAPLLASIRTSSVASWRRRGPSDAGQESHSRTMSHHKRWPSKSTYAEMAGTNGSMDSDPTNSLELGLANPPNQAQSPQFMGTIESRKLPTHHGVMDDVHFGPLWSADHERRGSAAGSLVCVYLDQDFHVAHARESRTYGKI